MLSYCPIPHTDESLYSIIARYHQQSANEAFYQTSEDLFQSKRQHSNILLPSRLGILAEQMEPFGIQFDQLLYQHTPYAFYTAFMPAQRQQEIYQWAKESQSGSVNGKLGVFGEGLIEPPFLRFCPQCYAQELEQHGHGYWHRSHQLPGVLCCPSHGGRLLNSKIPYHSRGDQSYHLVALANLFPTMTPPIYTPLALQQARCITKDIEFLQAHYHSVRDVFTKHQFTFNHIFLYLMAQKGWATKCGTLRLSVFRDSFLSHWDEQLLHDLGLWFSPEVKRPWIVSMCRHSQNKVTTNPLKYIVLARTFCGSLETLITLAQQHPPTYFTLEDTRQYGTVTDYEIKLERYRSLWLAACQRLPEASQNEVRNTAPAVYTWLIRHDKQWLSEHPKNRKRRGGNRQFKDRSEKDLQGAKAIKAAADTLYNTSGKPVQVTKKKLLLQSGLGELPNRILAQMPKTSRVIVACAESNHQWRLRRIAWAIDQAVAQDEPIIMWKIMKQAGIRDRDWEELWQAYWNAGIAEAK